MPKDYRTLPRTKTRRNDREANQATNALHLLLHKYAPHLQAGQDYRPVVPEELMRTSVYCISIEEWSGKKKEVAADFPGALLYQNKQKA